MGLIGETGFGFPKGDTLADPDVYSFGYGSSPPIGYGLPPFFPPTFAPPGVAGTVPTGYGHPVVPLSELQNVTIFGDGTYSDEGGDRVYLAAEWNIAGPYRVRLLNANGVTFPTDTLFAYSGVPGQGIELFANVRLNFLVFVLPRLPRGIYSIELLWGIGFSESLVMDDTLTVVRFDYAEEVYTIRKRFPPYYKTGAIQIRDEPDVEDL